VKNYKNVLFLTENLSPGSHTIDTLEGIEKISQNVITLDYHSYYSKSGKIKLEKKIRFTIESQGIDLLVINLGTSYLLDGAFLADISNTSLIKVVIIFPDPEHNFEDHDRYYAQCADICWLFATGTQSIFNLYGYETFCGQGFSITRYPKLSSRKIYDVSFVGGIERADRKKFINFLKSSGVNLKLAGYGTENGLVSVDEKNQIISSSHIHLNFTKVENKRLNIFNRVAQQKGRVIEASLIGTFVLSENCAGLRDVFSDAEVDIFSSPEELLSKVNFYLKHLDIVEAMSKMAHTKSLEYETSLVYERLLLKLNDIQISSKYFLEDDIFTKNFIAKRYYFFGKFIFLLKFRCAYDELRYIFSKRKISMCNIFYDIPRGIKHAFDTI